MTVSLFKIVFFCPVGKTKLSETTTPGARFLDRMNIGVARKNPGFRILEGRHCFWAYLYACLSFYRNGFIGGLNP